MRFFTALTTGFLGYTDAMAFIHQHKMYRYFLWPVVMHLLLFLAGFSGVSYLTDVTIEFLKSFVAENPEAWYNSNFLFYRFRLRRWICSFTIIISYFIISCSKNH